MCVVARAGVGGHGAFGGETFVTVNRVEGVIKPDTHRKRYVVVCQLLVRENEIRSMSTQLTAKGGETPHEGDGPSRDEVFTALSNRRRRNVITYLKQHGDDARVRDIAEQLAAWENDLEINEVSYKQRKRVYTALHQSHLPKRAEGGFIEYESDRGLVSLTEQSHHLEMYLEVVSENDILWSEFYVGLAVVCGLLAGAAAIGTVPFAAVSGYTYAVLFAVLFGIAGLIHRTVTRRNRVG